MQVGLNNRSITNVREAIKFLHEGGIGEVYMARGICYKARDSFGIAKDSTPPATFHYDRWLGPLLTGHIMKKEVITIFTGIGIPEMEILAIQGRINLILPDGG